MARTSNLANVATVSRATKAWYPGGWDFTNGGAITGDFVEYANNVARDGAQGLLVEEASTNEIRNPRCEGANAPSTFPTNWAVSGSNVTVVGSGYENGWPYLDVRWNPSGSAGNFGFQLEQIEQVTAASGQTWTFHFGARVVAGSMTNLVLQTRLRAWDSGASNWSYTGDAFPGTPDAAHRRFVQTGAITGTATSLVPFIFMDSTGAADVTLRIYAPQLEEKAYPTSPILPPASSPATSDRNADDIEVASGAWLASNDGPFSLYAEVAAVRPAPENSNRNNVVALSDGSFDNFASLYFITSPHQARARTQSGGAADSTGSVVPLSGIASPSGTIRLAAGWDTDDFAYSASGGTQVTDTSVTLPVGMDRLQIGADTAGRRLNGYIKNVRYWPRRLTNAELEALVGN